MNRGYRFSKAVALANYYADTRNVANFAGYQAPGGDLAYRGGYNKRGVWSDRTPGYGASMQDMAEQASRQRQAGYRKVAYNAMRRDPQVRNRLIAGAAGIGALGAGLGAVGGYIGGRRQEEEEMM